MRLKTLLLSVFVAGSTALSAQNTYDYDVTDVYLSNSGFNDNLALNLSESDDSVHVTQTMTVTWASYPGVLRLA